jgi:hypothetical protein
MLFGDAKARVEDILRALGPAATAPRETSDEHGVRIAVSR